MITAVRSEGTLESSVFSFYGLSTDTKPTGKYQGTVIMNGSTFFEMDTKVVAFYDGESQTWLES